MFLRREPANAREGRVHRESSMSSNVRATPAWPANVARPQPRGLETSDKLSESMLVPRYPAGARAYGIVFTLPTGLARRVLTPGGHERATRCHSGQDDDRASHRP